MKVVVAGAGIGGLTFAIALRRANIDVVILERAEREGAEGAGLMLQINAMRALRYLALEERVCAIGLPVHAGLGCDDRGRTLSELDMAGLSRELGAPIIALHRGRLHALLRSELGEGVVRTSARVASFEEREDGVDAILDGGERVSGDLLVGADGLRSAVRATMLADGEPCYAGYTSWRGVAKVAGLARASTITETWGRGLRFGAVEIAADETYWFAVANAEPNERDDDPRAVVAARFAHFPEPVPAIVAATDPSRVIRTDVHDRDPIDAFSRGRVALLGDAAHPTTPDLGQGGCLAIEDAVVLAKCLASMPYAPAFAEYDRKRVARTRKVVLDSRSFGKMGAIDSAIGVFFRNLALKSTPKSVVAKQSRKLVEFEL